MSEEQGTLSIYRRWRPQRFSEVVDQALVVNTIRRAVAQGRLAHAYLFAGQRGVGKTSVARILARAANCDAPQGGEPCNACPNCLRILAGRSLDVVEIDGASNRGIDQVRQLREEVGYVPAGAHYKVYVIDEVHMLTGEAFNALLKTLEEPPPHVIFVLATTEPHKVPATVLSRCQAFEFAPIPEELIQGKLLEVAGAEGVELEPTAAALVARRSGGSLRDALVLLEQLAQGGPVTEQAVVDLLGLPTLAEVDGFLDALQARQSEPALAVVDRLARRGRDLALFVEEAAARARDRIIAGQAQLVPLARRLLDLRGELPRAVSRRLHLEVTVLELCGPPARPSAPAGDPGGAEAHDRPAAEPEAPASQMAAGAEEESEAGRLWRSMWDAILEERVSVAAFLSPAQVQLVDGLLIIRLPEDCGFHYDALQEPAVRTYVEAKAQEFFGALLSVEIQWAGASRQDPSLEERAQLLARALEGRIIKEDDDAGTR
ncbi:MAG: DNA polymerase III subunit gamma/tau [Candidatus Bipolaricaulaceae bacterium]